MPFQPAKNPVNSEQLQKGQPPTNLVGHGDSLEAEVGDEVLEIVYTRDGESLA